MWGGSTQESVLSHSIFVATNIVTCKYFLVFTASMPTAGGFVLLVINITKTAKIIKRRGMDKNWLRGKSIVVVGASFGIGKYLSFNLILQYNCSILAISNNEKEMQEFYSKLGDYKSKLTYYIFDIKSEKAWQAFCSRISEENKKIDVLINCASENTKQTKIEESSNKDWQNAINLNFYSAVFSTRFLLPFLKESKTPAIINISCVSSSLSLSGTGTSSASKSALNSYTHVLAKELDDNFYVALVLLGLEDKNNCDKRSIFSKLMYAKNINLNVVANKIIRSLERKRSRIIVGNTTKLNDCFTRFAPVLAHKIIKRYTNSKRKLSR